MSTHGFVVAVAAVIVRGDRALAMRRSMHKDAGAGLWESVSGRLEPGEQPLEAMAREVREESGLDVRLDARPIDAYVTKRGERPMCLVLYRATWIAGEVRRSEEHDAHAWWTLDEWRAQCSLERLVSAVELALASA